MVATPPCPNTNVPGGGRGTQVATPLETDPFGNRKRTALQLARRQLEWLGHQRLVAQEEDMAGGEKCRRLCLKQRCRCIRRVE
jgi:hypothetical protein